MPYDRINCHLCERIFKQESRFTDHLVSDHLIEDQEAEYINTKLNGVMPTCSCSPECKEPLRWSGWKKGYTSKYARGHNARVDSVYLNSEKQLEFATKRKAGYLDGKYSPWNKGLSKSSSGLIAESSNKISDSLRSRYKNGETSWQSGLSKDTDERVKNYSIARESRLQSGEITVWNKGKNKESDERIFSLAKKISNSAIARGASRLTVDQIVSRISAHPQFRLVTPLGDYKNRHTRLEFLCVECNNVQFKTLAMLEATPVCHVCHPKESQGQIEVYEFVKTLEPSAVLSDRSKISPKELDIWVPSQNLGIEYNGLYWHSEKFLDSRYHVEKYNLTVDNGANILSIYDDEWRDKRAIVEGMIRHRLKKPEKVLDARKLTVKEISSNLSKDFFSASHLEGHAQCSTTIALVDSDTGQIISAMSLRRPFHKKYSGYLEVARCACLPGISVRGWLGRLTSAAKLHAKSIGVKGLMTYVDKRVGAGIGYSAAGWEYSGDTSSPRFWWTDGKFRYNRFKYKADSGRGMTQDEIATEAGVVKIWGLQNSLFLINFQP